MRSIRRLATLSIMSGALVIGAAWPAAAHADLVSSNPADGAMLEAAPDAVVLEFTEPPDLALSSVAVLDAGGNDVRVGRIGSIGERGLAAALPSDLGEGVYTVSWRVVSTEDGHGTAGSFAFGVGQAPPPAGSGEPSEPVTTATPLTVASKSLLYAGSMVLLASAVVGAGLFGWRPRRLTLVALIAGVAAFAGAVGLLIAEQRALGVSAGELLDSQAGRAFGRLLGVTLIAAGAAVLAAARPAWRWLLWVAGAGAGVAMGVRAFAGHAASVDAPLPPELAQWAHFIAAGLWIGGLVLAWLLVRETAAPATIVAPIRRYSRLAGWAVLVVVLTGLARTWSQLGGPGGLIDALDTAYGRSLAIKIVLALGIVGLGAVNRYRNIPRLGDDPSSLRRVLTTEVIAAAGVIVLTASLTSFDPSIAAEAAPAGAPVLGRAEGSDFATTTTVRLTLDPGTAGANVFTADVVGYDDGVPLPADAVTLRLASVTVEGLPVGDVTLDRDGERWVGQSAAISVAGTWRVTAQVRTGAEVAEVPMVLVTRSAAPDEPVPGARLTTASYADGVSLQLSLEATDPAEAFVHVTALTPGAGELPLESVTVIASAGPDRIERVEPDLVTPGHAIGSVALAVGATWTIDTVVTSEDGRTYQATLVDVAV
jgi:copper transport protein